MCEMWDDIAENLSGHVYVEVEGLAARFFDAKPWSSATTSIVHAIQGKDQNPALLPQLALESWLSDIQDKVDTIQHTHELTACSVWVTGGGLRPLSLSKTSLVLRRRRDLEITPQWSEVLAIGEFADDESYETGLFRLCEHAELVFSHQPARLFVHGFHVSHDRVTIWVFDREGMYGSKTLDIRSSPAQFLQILIAYMYMNDATLGVDNFVHKDGEQKFIEIGGGNAAESSRLYLDKSAIFARTGWNVVGDGLICYQARAPPSEHWQYAVKMKWLDPWSKVESKMLQLAMKKQVWGIPRLIWHQTVGTTDDWRSGLHFGTPRRLRCAPTEQEQDLIESATDLPVAEEGRGQQIPSKLSLECTIVEPLGDSLHRFRTVEQLLTALRDAIKCHRSLYLDGGILHQDICPGNIVIPKDHVRDQGVCDTSQGVLIDFDAAKLVTEKWQQFESVGTPPFQAIGVCQAYLPNNPHTYRHDLESFLYTFLFLAIADRPLPPGRNQLGLPENSTLRTWYKGRPADRARRKTHDMQPENYQSIVAEFKPDFRAHRTLANRLRDTLFPMRDGELWTGTDMTDEATISLYDSMISAFDEAILSHDELVDLNGGVERVNP